MSRRAAWTFTTAVLIRVQHRRTTPHIELPQTGYQLAGVFGFQRPYNGEPDRPDGPRLDMSKPSRLRRTDLRRQKQGAWYSILRRLAGLRIGVRMPAGLDLAVRYDLAHGRCLAGLPASVLYHYSTSRY